MIKLTKTIPIKRRMTQSIKSLLQLYFSKGWKVVAMLSFVIMVIRIKTLYQIKIF